MDILQDIMEVTALNGCHEPRRRERAVPVPNCWGRGLNIIPKQSFLQNARRLGRGRGVRSSNVFFSNGNMAHFNDNIQEELRNLEECKKRNVTENEHERAVFCHPVISRKECINFLRAAKSKKQSPVPSPNFLEEEESKPFSWPYQEAQPKPFSWPYQEAQPKPFNWAYEEDDDDDDEEDDEEIFYELNGRENCDINLPLSSEGPPNFSFKDLANSLTNQIKATPQCTKMTNGDVVEALNDDTAVTIAGISKIVTKEAILSYLESFGLVQQLKIDTNKDELVVQVWMKKKSDCEWIISCLDDQESPFGDSNRCLSVTYLSSS